MNRNAAKKQIISNMEKITDGQNTMRTSFNITNEPMYFIQGHSAMNTHETFRLKPRQWLYFRVKPDNYCLTYLKKNFYTMIQSNDGKEQLRQAIRYPESSFRIKGQLMRPGQMVQNVKISYNEKIPKFAIPVGKNNLNTAMRLNQGNMAKLKDLIGNDEGLFIISGCRIAGCSYKFMANALQKQKNKNNAADTKYMKNRKNANAFTQSIVRFKIHNSNPPFNNGGYETNTKEQTGSHETAIIIKKNIAIKRNELFKLIPTTRNGLESLIKSRKKMQKFKKTLERKIKTIKVLYNNNVKHVWTKNIIAKLMIINKGSSTLKEKEYKKIFISSY